MKCRDVIEGKCTNKTVNELNPQEDKPLKCSGHFSKEVIGCYYPDKKLRTLK